MHVVVDGRSRTGTPVVLFGGLGGNWFDWDGVARILSGEQPVVRIDRPGYGLSPASTTPLSARGEAERIAAVLDALGLDAPVLVAGHSLGGLYAEAFARLFPQRTGGILLLDATVTTRPFRIIPTRWRVEAGRRVARAASRIGIQHLLGPSVRRMLNHSTPPEGVTRETDEWVNRIYRKPTYLDASVVENASYPALVEELVELREHTHLTAPVLVAAAHTGRPTPWGRRWIRTQRRFAAFLGADFRIVRPAHHHAMIDQPHQVAALLRELAG